MMRVATSLFMAFVAFAPVSAFHLVMRASPRSPSEVLRPFKEGRALKVISGITNFDAGLVTKVAKAAEAGGATHLDVACDPALVKLAKEHAPHVCVMVSAIEPDAFGPAVDAGADMLELGNFDSFYDKGIKFSSLDIVDLSRRTRALFPRIPLSVTVPHVLSMDEQVALAQSLEQLGVDVIQTEGSPSVTTNSQGIQAMIEKAAPALAASFVLSRAVKSTPVMAASGITEVTAAMAIASGAKGIGVGAAVNKLPTPQAMEVKVRTIAQALTAARTDTPVPMAAFPSQK